MGKSYVGIDGSARMITGGYIGVDGVARKIKKAYIGVGSVARKCWSEPQIAYLYNGVRLPPLPEFDNTAYPHVVIFDAALQLGKTGAYRVMAMSKVVGLVSETNLLGETYDVLLVPTTVDYKQYTLNSNNDGWVLRFEQDGTIEVNWRDRDLLWTNNDLWKSDGSSIYLTASDPIPTYE